MFAEELSSNASRKRQQENRARRRQLKNEKQKQDAKATAATTTAATTAAAATTTPTPATISTPVVTSTPAPPPIVADAGETSGKSSAVANALQQRQLRQTTQLQLKSSIKIQSLVRAYQSNSKLLQEHTTLLQKRLSDLSKLATLIKKKNPDKPFVPPVATTTAFTQQLLFLTKSIPYQRRNSTTSTTTSTNTKDDNKNSKPTQPYAQRVHLRGLESSSQLFKQVLETCVLPGLTNPDDTANPVVQWLQQGTYRLSRLVHVAMTIATTPHAPTACVTTIGTFLRILVLGKHSHNNNNHTRNANSSLTSQTAHATIVPLCRTWFLDANHSDLYLFPVVRHFLLWQMGSQQQPIPNNSMALREDCFSAKERQQADVLFQLLTTLVTSSGKSTPLQARFVTEILTIPLLTWKLSPKSVAQLVDTSNSNNNNNNNNNNSILLVSMMNAFLELYQDPLGDGKIAMILPQVQEGIMTNKCPATNTQCLLANCTTLGRLCPSTQSLTATFFYLVAFLLDVVPLGTFLTRDSAAVEWVTDGKGHHTPIVLSPVILEQCKLLLVESYVRNLFASAIDTNALHTTAVLEAQTDKDKKHETDFVSTAGATATAMAAKEARVDRNRWLASAKWASKIKKGVSNMLTSSTERRASSTTTAPAGAGKLVETSSVSRQLASGNHTNVAKAVAAASNESSTDKRPYSPQLLFCLCRTYAIVLARWGGGGKADVIATQQQQQSTTEHKNEIATSRPDPCTMALLNVLCFGTDLVRTTWALLQSDKELNAELQATMDKTAIQSLTARPCFATYPPRTKLSHDSAVLLYVFVATISHALIITDDVEIHEMGRPLPLHQLRRCIQLLKKVLIRACEGSSSKQRHASSNPFGLSLVAASVKVMRDLYDRSARRPLCVPKLWLVDNLMVKEISNCKTHTDYVDLLHSSPVLRICPFLVSFKRRLKLFERIVTTSRIEMQGVNDANPFNNNPLKPGIPVQIMRGRVLEDGLATLNKLGRNLRQRINVQYLNEAGARESGVDAGGLFKEFWTDLCAIAFNPNYALFRVTEDEQNCLYPNPLSGSAHGAETHIVLFEFLGRILGKALYEGITISPQFSHFFLSFLRGDYNYLHMLPDLGSVDKQLYTNLMFLKTYDGDAEDLCLTFSVAVDEFGGNKQIPLIPNGGNKEVTNSNKQHYIGLVAKYYVVDRVKEQSEAFTRGLWDVIDKSWLRLFNEPELQVLISGATGGALDVEDMRAHSRYIGGYTGIETTIRRFWSVVASLNTKQQADLLRFVTSCERPPPLGFASMNPPFTIQRVGIMRDGDLLPTASTCFNTLKLPTYSSEKVMKQRLIYAIEAGAGFELT